MLGIGHKLGNVIGIQMEKSVHCFRNSNKVQNLMSTSVLQWRYWAKRWHLQSSKRDQFHTCRTHFWKQWFVTM